MAPRPAHRAGTHSSHRSRSRRRLTLSALWRFAGLRWRELRAFLRALGKTHPVPRLLISVLLLVGLWLTLNWIFHAINKPTEVLFPLEDALDKNPAATWQEYGTLFREHSTAIITPELLAALAQVEGAGNPVARTYWRWRMSWNPFEWYRPASSAVGMFQLTDGTFREAKRYCIAAAYEGDAGSTPAGACRIVLHDWLEGLFRDSEGRLADVVLDSSELIRERRYRHDKLLRHWLRHLALQRACGPVITVVIGKIGDVSFAPLAPAEAAARLDDCLLAAWAEGLRAPLPLPPLTAFAWLARMPAMPDGMPAETSSEAERHARLAYEGDGHKNKGECARSPYLRRAYPDFASLCADGRFATHAERLLRPLTLATPANAAGKGAEGRA